MAMLSVVRKNEIGELAESISNHYFINKLVSPEVVAKDNQITFSYGGYKDYFDGMIEHRSGRFHIYLNLDRLLDPQSPRARFTFAHELGHYFLDEHRNALKKGLAPSHPSFNSLNPVNIVEKEADFFASCFLAPSSNFVQHCYKTPLDPSLIKSLANRFQISISASIFRYKELNLFPMIIILSKNGIIQWSTATNDFRYRWPHKGKHVISSSAAGEFFSKGIKYSDKQIIFPEDWFEDVRNKSQQMYEMCYYLSGNTTLSMIWNKER